MSCNTYNPFPQLGAQFTDGMDYIIGNLPTPVADATFEQLNETLTNYLGTLLGSTDPDPQIPPIIDNMVYSILPNAANSYQNANLQNDSFYNEKQLILFSTLVSAVKSNDVEGIPTVLDDAGQEIAQSGLSAVDQAPLFAAVEMG